MTIKERFERFNNSVDKFADGKHIRCFVDAIFESVVFKYPTTFYFNYDFFAKKMHERHKFLSKRDAERYEALNPKDISILQDKVLGFQIPNWHSVITLAKESAELVPEFVWVGWDIAVTENGAALIEGNHNPSVDLIQIGCQGLKPKIENILKS